MMSMESYNSIMLSCSAVIYILSLAGFMEVVSEMIFPQGINIKERRTVVRA